MVIESQAPTRVDLAGGTLDIWPLYLFHENAQTINCAINHYARCRLTPRKDKRVVLASRDLKRREAFPSLEALSRAGKWSLPLLARLAMEFRPSRGFALETDSGVPAGSGLGGSSALNIALCGALARFTGRRPAPVKLIEIARNVEAQVLRVPTGEQDYYSAVHGGLQAIHLTAHGIQPEKMPVSAEEINARFVLCYSGESRNSGINNWEVQKAHIDGARPVVRHFDRITSIAAAMRAALLEREWNSVARLLRQEWEARRRNYPGITTPTIERLMALATRRGALAGKACGAGGGGCVIFFVKPGRKAALEAALGEAGAKILPFGVAARGLRVRTLKV
jgi:D-glycero-alpha-D-manno-heptose-7-phosphate kinase